MVAITSMCKQQQRRRRRRPHHCVVMCRYVTAAAAAAALIVVIGDNELRQHISVIAFTSITPPSLSTMQVKRLQCLVSTAPAEISALADPAFV